MIVSYCYWRGSIANVSSSCPCLCSSYCFCCCSYQSISYLYLFFLYCFIRQVLTLYSITYLLSICIYHYDNCFSFALFCCFLKHSFPDICGCHSTGRSMHKLIFYFVSFPMHLWIATNSLLPTQTSCASSPSLYSLFCWDFLLAIKFGQQNRDKIICELISWSLAHFDCFCVAAKFYQT